MIREELISNFVCYLERERNEMGLTQAQMAKQLDISVSGYKKMISGETTKIDLSHAIRMYEITGKLFVNFTEKRTDQSEILEDIQYLSPTQLRFIKNIIQLELSFQNETDGNTVEDFVNLLTLTGNQQDGMILDSANIEKLDISCYRNRFGDNLHCALHINSNHFLPVYNKEDILLISFTPPGDGDTVIYINRDEERVYLRRFRQTNLFLLEPLNHYGLPITINPMDKSDVNRWFCFGKILSKMRR